MAQFIAYDKKVNVNGQTILSVINAMDYGKDTRAAILKKHGLSGIEPEKWYNQQNWLDAFKEIQSSLGEKTLYIIGKAIPANAKFPPEIDSLEKALGSIDIAYHMNHSKGEIGHYKLAAFDGNKHEAVMVCNNPYPSEFDRGIIMAMVSKFRPKDSIKYDVQLDASKETRINGADSCTYKISW
ncbi:hypothetical protein C900_00043 [Fulvivirga imtechensis AK7]|uniref:L-2-amino-thiazoline-4-carboxylic acid hydrolase n=1 Tax=Fulvivirga imtechensis AK7 TaxID=1237149 RepID=L8K1R9_9BACT|nr:hypothetical protein [Fulvivirga imtechensis]ELR73879.1 hypothetical protein C900_00043 [Fulvivirga imtechensis AK7]